MLGSITFPADAANMIETGPDTGIFESTNQLSSERKELLQMGLNENETYELIIDENNFEIFYSTDGNVIAMAIDQELTSLLVGLENVEHDSLFNIEFSNELIRAENNAFAVLVNGYEVEYDISNTDLGTKLIIPIPAYTEEIEIIGTFVIPEFPLGIFVVLISLITIVVVFSKSKLVVFR